MVFLSVFKQGIVILRILWLTDIRCGLSDCLKGDFLICKYRCNLIQNSQVVKKECGPQKGYGEKRCEIQGGSQEMAVMVKILIMTIQVNLVLLGFGTKFT